MNLKGIFRTRMDGMDEIIWKGLSGSDPSWSWVLRGERMALQLDRLGKLGVLAVSHWRGLGRSLDSLPSGGALRAMAGTELKHEVEGNFPDQDGWDGWDYLEEAIRIRSIRSVLVLVFRGSKEGLYGLIAVGKLGKFGIGGR